MGAREDKIEQILKAAEVIVARDGSSKLTLEAVAQEAQVSKGGLLYHFPNKEALIRAMVSRILDLFDGVHGSAMLADKGGPGQWTRSYVHATLDEGEDAGTNQTTAGLLAAIANNADLAEPLRQRYVQWREMASKDGLPKEDAMIVALAADGLWMADLLGFDSPKGELRKRIIARMLELADSGTS